MRHFIDKILRLLPTTTSVVMLLLSCAVSADEVKLAATGKWQLENVVLKDAEHDGKAALSVQAKQQPRERGREHLAIIADHEFTNGTIELEVAGKPLSTAGRMARGFIGVAFRVQKDDPASYEAFYLRPTNGRAEDQLRRNHSVQYISHPDFPWNKLRKESPGKYESYSDLVPGEWTKVKVVVNGTDARLSVGGAEQPCLIVKDLKHGESTGAIALWIEPSTEGYFRNLRVTPDVGDKLTPDQLVGTWKYASGMKDGEELDAEHFKGQSVELTKKTLTLNSRTAEGEATFVMEYELDTAVSPTKISLEIVESPFGAGMKTEGIIQLRDGKLQICYPPMGDGNPKAFKAASGSGLYMFELRK